MGNLSKKTSLDIPINSTQEEFELLLQKNPDVIELNCYNCISLTSIPQLDKLELLDCYRCNSLTSIPQLDKLTVLDCSYCISLTSISRLDNLTHLICRCCTSLTSIHRLDNLVDLYCSNCTSLTSIPQLNNLTYLDCYRCISLTNIPQLDNLVELYWDSCTNLCVKNIGYLPKLKTDDTELKNQNEYYYKLTLIRPNISKAFGKYKGFTDDFMRMLETY
jgi:hypothetical protein